MQRKEFDTYVLLNKGIEVKKVMNADDVLPDVAVVRIRRHVLDARQNESGRSPPHPKNNRFKTRNIHDYLKIQHNDVATR